jgi:hypothetical protein
MEARRQVVLDLEQKAANYWKSRHLDSLDPLMRQTIRNWHTDSREWKEIAAEQPEWRKARRE